MKKVMFMILACVFISGIAYAAEDVGKGVSIDFSVNWGQGNKDAYPGSFFKGTGGFELGANVDLKRLGIDAGSSKGVKFQGRASISYYDWNEGDQGDKYRRIPLFVGIRGVVPVFTEHVKVYGQIGPEVSFDHQEDYSFRGTKLSDSDEVRIGITPGAGILFNISRISLGAAFNYHFIKDPFFSLGVMIGYNF